MTNFVPILYYWHIWPLKPYFLQFVHLKTEQFQLQTNNLTMKQKFYKKVDLKTKIFILKTQYFDQFCPNPLLLTHLALKTIFFTICSLKNWTISTLNNQKSKFWQFWLLKNKFSDNLTLKQNLDKKNDLKTKIFVLKPQ